MPVTIYYNPNCSKCRQTLALLREKDVEPTIVEYLETPPSAAELNDILKKLGTDAADIVRTKEAQEEGIDYAALDNAALIEALIAHPRVMVRPILINGDKAAVGRPPESVLDIL